MKKVFIVIISAFFLTSCTSTPKIENSPEQIVTSQVPLPSGTDVINLFWQLINEHRIPEAIAMMSSNMVPDDSTKQAYGVQFNDIKSVNVLSVEAYGENDWTSDYQTHKVTLEIYVDASAANAPIPYYGYEDNPNLRFISLVKNTDGQWQIDQIATGP